MSHSTIDSDMRTKWTTNTVILSWSLCWVWVEFLNWTSCASEPVLWLSFNAFTVSSLEIYTIHTNHSKHRPNTQRVHPIHANTSLPSLDPITDIGSNTCHTCHHSSPQLSPQWSHQFVVTFMRKLNQLFLILVLSLILLLFVSIFYNLCESCTTRLSLPSHYHFNCFHLQITSKLIRQTLCSRPEMTGCHRWPPFMW